MNRWVTQKNRKWWGLSALIPMLAMVFVDQTVLPVALPTIKEQLGAGDVALSWTVNAYLLATAVLVLAGGKMGDWMGHRRAFLIGMFLFAFSSLLCGISPDIVWMIGARTLQGAAAALMFPASTPLLMSLFPPNERGKATGVNVSVSSLFLILGPLIGGYLTEVFSWRWIFWINLPIAAIGISLVFLFIPPSRTGSSKIDLWGFNFFTLSSSFLVLAIMQGRDWGWTSYGILACFAFFLAGAISLFLREKKAVHPFLDLSLFRHPVYKAVNISLFSTQFILMVTVYRAIFLQEVLDWSPLKTGFVTFLSSSPVLFVSPIGGYLSDRFGPKLPIAMGFSFLIFSFSWLAFAIEGPLWGILLGFFAMGFGIPLVLTPSYASAMGSVPRSKSGVAFGTIFALRSLGGCLGVAVIGSLADQIQQASFLHRLNGQPFEGSRYNELISGDEMGLSESVLSAFRQAQIDGFTYLHLSLAATLLVAFIFVFRLYHRKSSHNLPMTPAEGWD